MTIKAMIFDVGDVLFDASVWRRWLAARLQAASVEITYEQLVAKWELLLADVYCGRAKYWERFRQLLQSLHLAEDQLETIEREAQQKAVEVQVDRSPFAGVPETLARLQARGIRLIALSDTESGAAKVREILGVLGVEQYFDGVITSKDIGCCKPDPRAYLAAVTAANVDRENCAFVGHDVDELQGASQASLLSIAYNYDAAAPADIYLDHFSELAELVPIS